MSLFSLYSPIHGRPASSLHRRFLNVAGLGGAVVILVLAAVVDQVLSHDAERQGDMRVADAADRASLVVSEALADRIRQARVLARTPVVIAAAREGSARANALGIVGGDIPTLEKRFAGPRSMEVAPAARQFLRDLLPEMDAAEFLLTDANGYNAVTTQLSSDFVQSDEAWWQSAWRTGISPADAAYDSSAHQITVSIAALVHDGPARAGVVKLAFSIAPLVRSLASAGAGVRIDVVDSTNRVVLSSDSAAAGRRIHGMPRFRSDSGRATSVLMEGELERAVGRRANEGRWRVVARLPIEELAAPFVTTRLTVVAGAALLLVVLALLLASMNAFLQRRISTPARELAEAAEAVAGGDFSVQLRRSSSDDEMGRLSRAVDAMILELRRLAQAIAGSARETSTMSAEITAGSEEMAATAGEIASTASDLSNQSALMAETIASLAGAAGTLRDLAGALDTGAHDGVARNTVLRTLALDNRAGLDASAELLRGLSDDIHASAAAVAALGTASEEIRSFVTLVRQLARQSKLLALNAAMEAARAGTQGAGFGVVALEVRRLASMSSEAAERTATIVKGVLKGIDASRASAGRAVATADEVRAAMATASSSFSDIERAVADAEAWTASIEQTSAATSGLVVEMTQRLDSLSLGTESLAAAMQQVAASSQEQSASTEEIAGTANALGSAAERMTTLVAGLKA